MSVYNICFLREIRKIYISLYTLREALLMSVHNICFLREIRKIYISLYTLREALLMSVHNICFFSRNKKNIYLIIWLSLSYGVFIQG